MFGFVNVTGFFRIGKIFNVITSGKAVTFAGNDDDTRAFCSIPARHDVSRRSDCAYLAELVVTGRLAEAEAFELAHDLTYRLAKEAYKL